VTEEDGGHPIGHCVDPFERLTAYISCFALATKKNAQQLATVSWPAFFGIDSPHNRNNLGGRGWNILSKLARIVSCRFERATNVRANLRLFESAGIAD
jgi:hypothetical protein